MTTEPPPPKPPPDPPPPELLELVRADPVGVKVYVSELLGWVIVSLSMPEEQGCASVPPLPIVELESACGEMSVKGPPVEDERVTRTLVAFTSRKSATDPVAIVSVVEGEVIEMDSAVVKLSGAACATPFMKRPARMIGITTSVRFRGIVT